MRCVSLAHGRCLLLVPAPWYENAILVAWARMWAAKLIFGSAIFWACLYVGSMWAAI